MNLYYLHLSALAFSCRLCSCCVLRCAACVVGFAGSDDSDSTLGDLSNCRGLRMYTALPSVCPAAPPQAGRVAVVVQWAKNPSVGLVGVITSSLSDVQSGLELPFLLVLGDVIEEYLQM